MIFEKLCKLLAEQFGVDPKTITAETTFAEDLKADSLDFMELLVSLEEEFGVGEIDQEKAAEIKTVGDTVHLIYSVVE